MSDWERVAPVPHEGAASLFEVRSTTDGTQGLWAEVPVYAQEAESFAHGMDQLGTLSDPILPRVLDSGSSDEMVWAVLERPAGEALEERLARGPLTWPEVLALGRALANSISELHALELAVGSLSVSSVVLGRRGPRLTQAALGGVSGELATSQRADVTALVRLLVHAATGVRPSVNANRFDPGPQSSASLRAFFARWTGPEAESQGATMDMLARDLQGVRLGRRWLWRGCAWVLGMSAVVALGGGVAFVGGVEVLKQHLDEAIAAFERALADQAGAPAARSTPAAGKGSGPRPTPVPGAELVAPGTGPEGVVPPASPPSVLPDAGGTDAAAVQTAPAATGEEVRLHARPEGARVWVDGVEVGLTPLTLHLERGRHKVRMGRPDGVFVEERIRVGKGGGAWAWQGGSSLDEWN